MDASYTCVEILEGNIITIYKSVEDRFGDTYRRSRCTHARKETSPVRQCEISGRYLFPRH